MNDYPDRIGFGDFNKMVSLILLGIIGNSVARSIFESFVFNF